MHRLSWATVVAALVGFRSVTEAHIGEYVFPVYELPSGDLPDLRDGTLNDWEEVVPGPSLGPIDFGVDIGTAAIDLADLTFEVYLAWHYVSQRIYVGIRRVDDVYVNTYEGGGDQRPIMAQDHFDFLVDGDHTGGPSMVSYKIDAPTEEDKLLVNRQAQVYFALPESPDGRLVGHWGFGAWATLPPYVDAGGFQYGEGPNVSGVEMYVTAWDELDWRGPDRSVPSLLAGDRIIGFHLGVFDIDEGGWESFSSTGSFYAIFGQWDPLLSADTFADGLLIPCERGDCSGAAMSAVQPESWARIKASIR